MQKISLTRFNENPLVTPESSETIGTNINGPSIIKTPGWLGNALGRYYCYFAHHHGDHIRLAYADDIHGPWRIYLPGTLQLNQCPCVDHIASPDVHIDYDEELIIMYYHGVISDGKTFTGQRSYVATSHDGLHFESYEEELGPFYFRVFSFQNHWYALAKSQSADSGGILLHTTNPLTPFQETPLHIPNMRHAAINQINENTFEIFYSRIGDNPEHILRCELYANGDVENWTLSNTQSVLKPEKEYEGVNIPIQFSRSGAIMERVHEVRDPGYFRDPHTDEEFLFYSIAGESGLAAAEIIRLE